LKESEKGPEPTAPPEEVKSEKEEKGTAPTTEDEGKTQTAEEKSNVQIQTGDSGKG